MSGEQPAIPDETLEFPVPAALAGERVDRTVAMLTGLSRAEVSRLIEQAAVSIDGHPAPSRGTKVREGQMVAVTQQQVAPPTALVGDPSVELNVVHQDQDLAVIDKPPGLVVHPGSGVSTHTLVQGALARWPELAAMAIGPAAERPGIVHRLDKGTSGLLVVARTPQAASSLTQQLRERSAKREYAAIVLGSVEADQGLIDAPLGRSGRDPTRFVVDPTGKPARTRYQVEQRMDQVWPSSLVACHLETGRTHQIRVHMSAINHPVMGDRRYGGQRAVAVPDGLELDLPGDRPMLHARRLSFVHPRTGEEVTFTSPLPEDLRSVLDSLG